MEQIILINPEDVTLQEAEQYSVREAARAIVFDDNKLVALLHATKYDYYKLPGGGIEKGESPEVAMKRECLEEIGCEVEIIADLGTILEYRKKYMLRQRSYCYITRLVGNKGTPNLMDDEVEEGFETVWLSLEEALKRVCGSSIKVYEAQYMVARDKAFLEAVNMNVIPFE